MILSLDCNGKNAKFKGQVRCFYMFWQNMEHKFMIVIIPNLACQISDPQPQAMQNQLCKTIFFLKIALDLPLKPLSTSISIFHLREKEKK